MPFSPDSEFPSSPGQEQPVNAPAGLQSEPSDNAAAADSDSKSSDGAPSLADSIFKSDDDTPSDSASESSDDPPPSLIEFEDEDGLEDNDFESDPGEGRADEHLPAAWDEDEVDRSDAYMPDAVQVRFGLVQCGTFALLT